MCPGFIVPRGQTRGNCHETSALNVVVVVVVGVVVLVVGGGGCGGVRVQQGREGGGAGHQPRACFGDCICRVTPCPARFGLITCWPACWRGGQQRGPNSEGTGRALLTPPPPPAHTHKTHTRCTHARGRTFLSGCRFDRVRCAWAYAAADRVVAGHPRVPAARPW